MIFEKGKKYYTNYETPYGQFAMAFHTIELDVHEEEDEISVKVKYNLELNDEVLTVCSIDLSVKPKEQGISL